MKEGKTPMTKNVTVVDEQGNQHGATYPKRAKGLVKNGRARFVDENTICLACPPNEILEDTEMSENININENTNQNAVLTEKEVFDQIVLLQKQLTEQSLTSLHPQREGTLREILELYKQMYHDLQQEKREQKMAEPESEAFAQKRKEFLNFVRDTTAAAEPGTPVPDFAHIWKTVFLGQ
jgi:hypothetical protein